MQWRAAPTRSAALADAPPQIEWLAQSRRRHGHTLHDRALAALLNARNRSKSAAALGERWLGVSARRSLPAWRADTFWRQASPVPFVSREQVLAAAGRGDRVAGWSMRRRSRWRR